MIVVVFQMHVFNKAALQRTIMGSFIPTHSDCFSKFEAFLCLFLHYKFENHLLFYNIHYIVALEISLR